MKVLLVNGSLHAEGMTARQLSFVEEGLAAEDVEAAWFQVGAKPIQDCIDCGGCSGRRRERGSGGSRGSGTGKAEDGQRSGRITLSGRNDTETEKRTAGGGTFIPIARAGREKGCLVPAGTERPKERGGS